MLLSHSSPHSSHHHHQIMDKENTAHSSSSHQPLRASSRQRSSLFKQPASAIPKTSSSSRSSTTASSSKLRNSPYARPSSLLPSTSPKKKSAKAAALEAQQQQQQQEGLVHAPSATAGPSSMAPPAMRVMRAPEGPVLFERGGSAFLPLSLPRPARGAQIDVGAIEVLEGVPFAFVLEKLVLAGPSLLAAALSSRLASSSPSGTLTPPLPTTLPFTFHPSTAEPLLSSSPAPPPNYVLAIRPTPSSSHPSPIGGSILPIHDLVYRSFCAHLPSFPPRDEDLPETDLPVISITLPSPSTLPTLNTYLYTQRPDVLLATLLALPAGAGAGQSRTRGDLTNALAATMDVGQLMQRVALVHGVWANVCALGVADGLLWKAMDTAWEVLVGSVAVVQRRGQML